MPKGIHRDQSTNHQILRRLRISRGHLDKVIKMVEDGVYCVDVIHQSQAVQSALQQTDELVLKNHLETCVSSDIKKGHGKKAIEEIMTVVEYRR